MLFKLLSSKLFKTAACFVVILATVAVFCLSVQHVLAQASLGLEVAEATGLGTANLMTTVVKVIRIVLGFLGILAVIVVLYGGFIYMTSEGQEDKIAKAKKILINGAIGLLIILSAFAIVSYIIGRMQEVMYGGGEAGQRALGFDINIGALGGGVLESVYPEPWAQGVPRNTLIMVTFKDEMDTGTIISGTAHDDCPDDDGITCGILAGQANDPNIKIINRDQETTLPAGDVMVVTRDNKNFVFDPYGRSHNLEDNLGNPNGFSNYAVNLSENIDKANGQAAFLSGGYTWFFEVSNILDLIPPVVIDVIPISNNDPENSIYMNTVVQIDFNEAINAMSAVGVALVNDDTGQLEDESFNNIMISYDDNGVKYVSGTFTVSNQFRTVTFVSNSPCLDEDGEEVINSCGETPNCLPGDEQLTSLIKAALVDGDGNVDIFSGINDAAGNSLDGGGENGANANGTAEGSPEDDYWWGFWTNSEMWLTPPQIVEPPALEPERDAVQVPRNKKIKARFNIQLLSSSVNSDNISLFKHSCQGDDFSLFEADCFPPFSVYKENYEDDHRVVFKVYAPYLEPLTRYTPRLTSEIKDIYQNCFYPACGPGAGGECVE